MHHVPDEIKNTIGKALGKIPSGVYIVTAEHGGKATAMLASWVQQAAFAPPAITIAIAPDRPIAQLIAQSKKFAVSITPETDTTLMKRFARGLKPDEDPFAGLSTLTTPSGQRFFADALAWLDCRLLQTCTFGGDHQLIIAEVTSGALLGEGKSFAHQRGNGFHY
ncbi:MAG TPA: flavin reductase family protein [Tepidisphaeraceae bacterium]|jgi:flavin reductase (DIM6/NTAB) family NADH-FMN oxidoreductase RutF